MESLRFNQQADGSLKTVNRHDRSNKFCSVFVSNLTTETKSADVVSFLHKKHNRQFKVVQIPSKFNDCVSFKVVVPVGMKDTMLDKRNWTKNVYMFVSFLKIHVVLQICQLNINIRAENFILQLQKFADIV